MLHHTYTESIVSYGKESCLNFTIGSIVVGQKETTLYIITDHHPSSVNSPCTNPTITMCTNVTSETTQTMKLERPMDAYTACSYVGEKHEASNTKQ